MAKKKKRSVPVAKTGEERRRESRVVRGEAPKPRNPQALAAKQRSGAGAHGSKARYSRHRKHPHREE